MKKLFVISMSILFASIATAREQSINLTYPFAGYQTVKISSVVVEGGNALAATLVSTDTQDRALPEICLPEGGDPSLWDVYTTSIDKKYLLLTCKWVVTHVGLGIKGKEYKAFIYSEGEGDSKFNFERKLGTALSGYEGTFEGEGKEYFWYANRDIAKKRIMDVIEGFETDSLDLVEMVILNRLIDGDTMAISSYLQSDRVAVLEKITPFRQKTIKHTT